MQQGNLNFPEKNLTWNDICAKVNTIGKIK